MLEIQKIITVIEQCCENLVKENISSNGKWTSEIKQSVVNFAVENNNNFCICVGGNEIKSKDNDEWLYDITIIKMFNDEFIEYIDTVIESEWGDMSQILEDFQKVIQANAKNKLMICQDSKLSANDIFDKLQTQLNVYSDFSGSDSVTILCFDNANKQLIQKCIRKQQ